MNRRKKKLGFTLVFALLVLVVAYLKGGDPFRLLNIIGAVGLGHLVSLILFGEERDVSPPPKKLFIRVSPDGKEVGEEENKLQGDHYYIKGELVSEHRPAGESLEYWIPSDVRITGLRFVAPWGWVLCEEEENRTCIGRAWMSVVKPPRNEVWIN